MRYSLLTDDQIHADKSGDLSHVAGIHESNSLHEFSAALLEFHVCAGVFADNKRCKASFEHIDFLQFDFDNGTTMDTVVAAIGGFDAVISASKNHLRDKQDGKGVIPRFHLFVPLRSPITDACFYSFCVEHLATQLHFDCDRAAKDCSRYFYKHREELFYRDTGKRLDAEVCRSAYDAKIQRETFKAQCYVPVPSDALGLESFMRTRYHRQLLDGVLYQVTGKNEACARILGAMKKCGMSRDESVSLVLQHCTFGETFTRQRIERMGRDFFR